MRRNRIEALSNFLDALDSGYDLTEYEDPLQEHKHLCGCPEMGTYEGQVILVAPDFLKHKWPDGIGIDVCLALEIQGLWRRGIETSGHCCGHGRAAAYISVWPESEAAMVDLGYEVMPHPIDASRSDHFIPKTKLD